MSNVATAAPAATPCDELLRRLADQADGPLVRMWADGLLGGDVTEGVVGTPQRGHQAAMREG